LTFISSIGYHSTAGTPRQELWLRFDYSAVFLLIAGTYTPIAVLLVPKPAGWWLLGAAWGIAAFGMVWALSGRTPATVAYGAHALLGVVVLPALLEGVATEDLVLIGAGLGSYLVGALFYFAQRLVFNHLIWHVAVLLGIAFHFVVVLRAVSG
ncbi:MAG: hemolysin III family protein, partial [Myxococcota bacterium]